MTGETSNSTDAIDHILNVMKENETFLLGNAGVAYDEIVCLINEAIDYVGFSVKGKKPKQASVLSASG